MARAGDTVDLPLAGTRIVFLKAARDTNNELLQLDVFIRGVGRRADSNR
jgi:hypothetical protein